MNKTLISVTMRVLLVFGLLVMVAGVLPPTIPARADFTAIEDFTTYTEVDPFGKIVVTPNRSAFNSLGHASPSYVYKDFGAGYFSGDFTHYFTFSLTTGINGGRMSVWGLSNDIGNGHQVTDGLFVQLRKVNAPSPLWRLNLSEKGGSYSYHIGLSPGSTYYAKVTRVGGTLAIYLYSDPARTALVGSTSVGVTTTGYRYLYATQNYGNPIFSEIHNLTGFTENLFFETATSADFSWSPEDPGPGENITFDASGSVGEIVSYNWTFGDSTTGTGGNVTHAYQSVGDYTVTLAVSDNAGVSDNISKVVSVNLWSFVTKWGSKGSGDGQLYEPYGIAVSSNGYVYVSESANHRIQKFSGNGAFITKWGSYGSGIGQFHYPFDIAVSSDGYVYVADRDNHRVQKFSDDGTFITQWGSYGSGNGQFNRPRGIAVSSDGYVYVSEQNNHRIQKFSENGTFITKWGSFGSGNGQFDEPRGIAVSSDGYVYVTEWNNHRVQKFSENGTFITKWGSYGSGDGEFSSPRGITASSIGHVYVLDTYNHRVQQFTDNGTFITKWGSYGSGDGEFSSPRGIAISSDGYIYVADSYNYRVQKFAPIWPINAEFEFSPEEPEPDIEVTFDASASYASGQIESYEWDFDDNTTGENVTATHAYQNIGDYNVTLTVTDNYGFTDSTSKVVSVRHWSLFKEYAPVLYLHNDELFRTREISSMLDQSDLKNVLITSVAGPISTANLSDYDAIYYYLDMWNASSDPFPQAPNPERFTSYQPTIYGREYEYNDLTALQYWFFYPYNNWLNNHEGDWEMVTVFVNKYTGMPDRITCAQHWDGLNYEWGDVEKVEGTHPKIFIARGSHSSWGTKGEHEVFILVGIDYTSDNGTVLYSDNVTPEEITGVENKQLYNLVVMGAPHSWKEWKGHWGEFTTIIPFSEAPRSPAHQGDNKWDDPLAWANGLPYAKYVAQTGSPVNLHAYDQYGNHVGLNEVGEIEYEIPGTYIYRPSEEDEEVMIIYTEEDLRFEIEATGVGQFDFDIARYIKSENKEVVAEYENVLITENTTAMLEVNPSNPRYVMEVDLDSDGTVDSYKEPDYSVGINAPPVADADGPYVGEEGSPITFTAANSTDPDDDPLQYRWDFNGDGTWDTGWLEVATANHTWGDDFAGSATLEVSDGEFIASDNTSVTVNNVAPIAEAGPDQIVEVFDLVSFNGSFSDPSWLDTHTFEWDFGDNITASGQNVTHTYGSTDNYTVTFTVIDDDGGTGVDTAQVTIKQTYGTWANSTSHTEAIDWSGSNINVTGKIHSNDGIKVSGSVNTVNGTTTYVSSFNDSGSDNSYTPPPVQDEVKSFPVQYNLADYQPGGSEALAAQAEGKYHYIDGNLEVSDSGVVLDGLYYVTGEVKLSGSAISGQFTIISEEDISQDISGSEFDCRAYSGDLLFLSNGILLKMAGSNSYFEGVVYVPNGEIELSGSENTFNGSIFGNTVILSGSYVNITAE